MTIRPRRRSTIGESPRAALRRVRPVLPLVAAVTVALLVVRAAAPAPAYAVDLFPIDDWIGDGLKGIGKIALGPLKFGAEQIAHLIGGVVAALADLLVPKSFVKAGVNGIRWLVQLPALGVSPTDAQAVPSLGMPHLRELRDTLTWIGLTLLPLQLVVAGGRSVLSPTVDRDSPSEVLQRTIFAALALIGFDWAWGAMTHLSGLVTDSLLRMPWVADGVERMLESLLIGGAAGTAVASEFVIPLLLAAAGAVLFALMLLRIGLAVIASLVYATGGLALGLSVSSFGHRILQVWLVAATGVFVLPVLWCIVFVCASALMLDTGGAGGRGGFGDFVGQLYNTGAALVTFVIAIKLARATLGHAATAIAGLTATMGGVRGGLAPRPRLAGTAAPAGGRGTPQSLSRFSAGLRGGMAGAAAGGARVTAFPVRHPVQAAGHVRHPVQATRDAAEHLRSSMRDGAVAGASRVAAGPGRGRTTDPGLTDTPRRAGRAGRVSSTPAGANAETSSRPRATSQPAAPVRGGRKPPPSNAPLSSDSRPRPTGTPRPGPKPTSPPQAANLPASSAPAAATAPPTRPSAAGSPPATQTTDAAAARAWQATRRVTPTMPTTSKSAPKRAARTTRRKKP